MNRIHASGIPAARFGFRIFLAVLFVLLLRVDLRSESGLSTLDVSEQAKISVTTDLVILPVNVTDSNNEFVSELQREQGKLQKVTLFTEEDAPVTAGILVDHSRSMGFRGSARASLQSPKR